MLDRQPRRNGERFEVRLKAATVAQLRANAALRNVQVSKLIEELVARHLPKVKVDDQRH